MKELVIILVPVSSLWYLKNTMLKRFSLLLSKSHPIILQVVGPPSPFHRLMKLWAKAAVLPVFSILIATAAGTGISECMTRGMK